MPSKLFVRRDPLHLVGRKGRVIQIGEMPRKLSRTPLTSEYHHFGRFPNKLLPVMKDRDLERVIENYSKDPPSKGCRRVNAFWSGYRSCVVFAGDKMFRLKGMSFNTVEPIVKIRKTFTRIEGGQLLRNAENERVYSDKFNEVLRNEGILPPMEYVGMYKYRLRADGDNLATSIIRIEGDTRLDELFYVCERLFLERKDNKGPKFIERTSQLYFDLGYVVGKLKRLMDKSGQTWSDNSRRSNANIGNVVLHTLKNGKVGVGLVDFDASCDSRDKSKSGLKLQQKAENKLFIDTVLTWSCSSLRRIGIFNPLTPKREVSKLRKACARGFEIGYHTNVYGLNNTIESEQIYGAFGITNPSRIP